MERLLRIVWLLLFFVYTSHSRADVELTVAIVPQFPPDQIYSTWTPVLDEIAKMTGLRLVLKPYSTIPDFELAFRKGAFDVAYMNPYHAVMAMKAAGYIPIVRDGHEDLTGILVVRKGSPIKTLADLKGASIAFPSPNAFGASLYMRALLSEEAGLEFFPVYRTTHSNVYRHVIAGRAAAGGGVRRTIEREPPEVREQLRVLYETPPAKPHPVVVHPRVPEKTRKALQGAFLALGQRQEARPLLAAILLQEPVRASYADYAPLEKLGLERFVVLKED